MEGGAYDDAAAVAVELMHVSGGGTGAQTGMPTSADQHLMGGSCTWQCLVLGITIIKDFFFNRAGIPSSVDVP